MTRTKDASNTRYWDALGKTDPAHTKPFNRAGGFKGTAMKPIWIVKRMTEEFGPVGEGWGMSQPEFQVVTTGPGDEILVYCTVAVWHTKPEYLFYGVGGDKVLTQRKSGAFVSDEAFKMAYTDAVNNALKYIGVGADIHMGQFDDSKYVSDMREEFRPEPEYIKRIGELRAEISMATTDAALDELLPRFAEDIAAAEQAKDPSVVLAKREFAKRKKDIAATLEDA